jgi:hypothetical protein
MKPSIQHRVRIALTALQLSRVLRCALATAMTSTLVACQRPPAEVQPPPPATAHVDPEVTWAATALARNPGLELLATDTAAGVFTVRIKSNNEVRTLRLNELAAAPLSQLSSSPTEAAGITAAADKLVATTPAPVAQPAPATVTPEPPSTTAASPSDNPATAATTNYTIDRADGKVKISGPGVSIVSSGTVPSTPTTANETPGTGTIICEGRRLLHLDERAIKASGDAIVARGGCELFITNSRIVAGGTAVIVHDAIVHITNSTIEGGTASVDANDQARLLIRSSMFKGVQRRSERAVLQDQGGNQWR